MSIATGLHELARAAALIACTRRAETADRAKYVGHWLGYRRGLLVAWYGWREGANVSGMRGVE